MKDGTGKRKYQNHLVVGIVCLLCGISVSLTQYKVPTIMTDIMGMYGMDASGGAWMMSIFTFVGIFLAIPIGALAKKIGAKTVMLIASGVVVIGSVIGAFAFSAGMLIFSRGIEGVALTMVTACGTIVIEKTVAPEKIGSAMGIWGVWGSAGSTIAALITPTIFATIGFTGLWLSYAGFAVLTALLLAFVVKMPSNKPATAPVPIEGELAKAGESEPVEQAGGGQEPKKLRYRDVFTKNMVLLFISFISFNVCLLAVLSFVPTILQMKGFDQTFSGFATTLPMILSLVACPVFGMLSDRFSWKPLLVISVFFLGPCAFVMYNFTGPALWIADVLMGLVGLGSMAMMLVALMKLMPCPEIVEMGMGCFITVQCLGQFLGSYLVQMLLGPTFSNTVVAGAAVLVLCLIGTFCAARIKV